MTDVQAPTIWHADCVFRPEFVRNSETGSLAADKETKMASKNMRPSPNLELALSELEELVDLGIKFVPVQPSHTMIQAGARAGGVDESLAAKIYRAMLEADALEDPDVLPGPRAN